MRPILSFIVLFAMSATAAADPLVMTVTDRDPDGIKYDKNLRKITIRMVHSADLERRLIAFLKTQELHEQQPWRHWEQLQRKDGDIVNCDVFVTVSPGFLTFRLVADTETQKVFVVDGHASFAGMRALSGDEFQLKSLGKSIIYERKKLR